MKNTSGDYTSLTSKANILLEKNEMTQNIYNASFIASIIQENISKQEKEQENVDYTQEEKNKP